MRTYLRHDTVYTLALQYTLALALRYTLALVAHKTMKKIVMSAIKTSSKVGQSKNMKHVFKKLKKCYMRSAGCRLTGLTHGGEGGACSLNETHAVCEFRRQKLGEI